VKNGKRYDACLNLAAILARIGNVDHTFFHLRAINFVRDGTADGLLVTAGALQDCALEVIITHQLVAIEILPRIFLSGNWAYC